MAFEWIPIYDEIAKKLKDYRNNRTELINILRDMKKVGLKTVSLKDEASANKSIELEDIDPFTFFANFNRKITLENRQANLRHLKKALSLESSIPEDFSGLPTIDNRRSWLFSHKRSRGNTIELLWKLFEAVMACQSIDDISEQLFNDCLSEPYVSTNLTMGLFWVKPDTFAPLDKTMSEYLKAENVPAKKLNIKKIKYQGYRELIHELEKKFNKTFFELSHDAYINRKPNGNNYWLFQGNPDAFDFKGALQNESLKNFGVTSHIQKIKKGDKAILWISGQDSGCYALLKIASDPYPATEDNKDIHRVDVEVEHDFCSRPVRPQELSEYPEFADFKAGNQGRNFKATRAQYEKLLELALNPPGGKKNGEEIDMRHIPLNRIFYGPPGTGKTYAVYKEAVKIIDPHFAGNGRSDIMDRYKQLVSDGQIRFVTFHQSYSYEEFIEGIRPEIAEDQKNVTYSVKDGILKTVASAAQQARSSQIDKAADQNYVLIIDEINRGNISKVFGEAITLLEPDKRIGAESETKIMLPYSKEEFGLPGNLYILGTMNTADRSIALMDVALRRRFRFVEFMPDVEVMRKVLKDNNNGLDDAFITLICRVLKGLNERIEVLLDRDHQIGHSYFLKLNEPQNLVEVWNHEIMPLLQEYFYHDWDSLKMALNNSNNQGFVSQRSMPPALAEHSGLDCYYEFCKVNDISELKELLKHVF